jgi:hypothetical protein
MKAGKLSILTSAIEWVNDELDVMLESVQDEDSVFETQHKQCVKNYKNEWVSDSEAELQANEEMAYLYWEAWEKFNQKYKAIQDALPSGFKNKLK